MDKALVFGTKDCRLESCQGQFDNPLMMAARPWLTASPARWTRWHCCSTLMWLVFKSDVAVLISLCAPSLHKVAQS